MEAKAFNQIVKNYYRHHGRHDLPWRKTKDPYRILVSEIMLQQTQVSRVIPFYENFIKQFPNFTKLAQAKTSDVLRTWQGLGYNRRAIALQKLSRIVLEKFNGTLPRTREELESLPGIGKGTSGSLMAFAFNQPEIFVETNIRRVFIHHFFPAHSAPQKAHKKFVTDAEIERCIKRTINKKNPREWYWALMDYGSSLASRSKVENPNRRSAHYARQSKFTGSDRELRGKILKLLLVESFEKPTMKNAARIVIQPKDIAAEFTEPLARVKKILKGLVRDGFIQNIATKGQQYCINN